MFNLTPQKVVPEPYQEPITDIESVKRAFPKLYRYIDTITKQLNYNTQNLKDNIRPLGTLQSLVAADRITHPPDAVEVEGNGSAVTLTSVPTISNGYDGERLIVMGTDDTNTVTLQDGDTLSGSNVQLGEASVALGKGDALELFYSSTLGDWYELNAGVYNARYLKLDCSNAPLTGNLLMGTSNAIQFRDSACYIQQSADDGIMDIVSDVGVAVNSPYLEIGVGSAGVDYALKFNGETNDGLLTWKEDEDYFLASDDVALGNGEFLIFDKASGNGIKVDTTTPVFTYRDILGEIKILSPGANDPTLAVFRDSIRVFSFSNAVMNEAFFSFHIPHDYVIGSDILIHTHWSQNVVDTGGTAGVPGNVKWQYEISYSKGHNQAAFPASFTTSLTATASSTQYQHMLNEVQLSAASPSATQIDSDLLEPDGVILCRFFRDPTDVADTLDQVPFVHYVDLHYLSSNIGTKGKAPNFYS